MVVTIGWRPFAMKGFSIQQTRTRMLSAFKQWSNVCGLRFAGSSQPHVYIFGVNSNGQWGGLNYGRYIYIDVGRQYDPRTGRMIFMHEFGHSNGLSFLPNLGHSTGRHQLMHPNGSIYRWFGPNEANWAGRRYGRKTYEPLPVKQLTRRRNHQRNNVTAWERYLRTIPTDSPHHPLAVQGLNNAKRELRKAQSRLSQMESLWNSGTDARIIELPESDNPRLCACFNPVSLTDDYMLKLEDTVLDYNENNEPLTKPLFDDSDFDDSKNLIVVDDDDE